MAGKHNRMALLNDCNIIINYVSNIHLDMLVVDVTNINFNAARDHKMMI